MNAPLPSDVVEDLVPIMKRAAAVALEQNAASEAAGRNALWAVQDGEEPDAFLACRASLQAIARRFLARQPTRDRLDAAAAAMAATYLSAVVDEEGGAPSEFEFRTRLCGAGVPLILALRTPRPRSAA